MKALRILFVTVVALGAATVAAAQTQDADGVWTMVAPAPPPRAGSVSAAIAGPQVVVALNRAALDARLAQAPREDAAGRIAGGDVEFALPMPDGTFARFRVVESPILAPELEALFPAFKTYLGRGVDDPTATARFDWTAAGFHAMVLRAAGTVLIDPEAIGDLTQYVSYRKADVLSQNPWVCLTDGQTIGDAGQRLVNTFPITNGTNRLTYRLVLAATGEYTAAAGASKESALSRITTTMNRVNGVYERELAVHLTVATGPDGDPLLLIFTDGTTDPYTNNDGVAMLSQNQTTMDDAIGTANYDIGHVFSTGGGGVASLRVPCVAGAKARGVTGLSNPVGDGFDIDFVAHEMGHQFGGNHTFNASGGNCNQISPSHAYEVGGGITIMAYAGICSPQDLARHSIDNFHVESLNEITAFITSGAGATCPVITSTGNLPPAVGATANYTIPMQTPFALTATGSPSNSGNTLTYNWEEYDLGTASTTVAEATTDNGSRPLVRPYSSTTTTGTRTVPSLTYILNNANAPPQTYPCVGGGTCLVGETLPATSRTMRFQVTLRDNNAGAGAIATASMDVTSTTSAGPFAVTAPNTAITWTGGSAQAVNWNVASTNGAPVNAANVKISLSTDGGLTFPTVLAGSVPNNGAATVTVPDTPTSTARVKVEAVGNIFFDISDANFTITAAPPLPVITSQPASQTIAFGAAASLSVVASGTGLSYQWFAGSSGVTANPVGTNSSSYTTVALINNTKYWVRVSNASGGVNSVTAQITVAFTDDPLTATSSVIRAVHMTELRTRINGLRARFSLAAFSFSDTITAGATTILAQHIIDLRTALAEAYVAAGVTPAPTYIDPSLSAGTLVKAVHISEIRTATQALEF